MFPLLLKSIFSGSLDNRLLNGRFTPFKQGRGPTPETSQQSSYTPNDSATRKPSKGVD